LKKRAYYGQPVERFLDSTPEQILGELAAGSTFAIELTQRDAWREQILVLQAVLAGLFSRGRLYFEYAVPRLGKRIDVVLIVDHVIFVLEFKVGEKMFLGSALDQVWDYALDLKNFHETSHDKIVVPVLVATGAQPLPIVVAPSGHKDGVALPIRATPSQLPEVFERALRYTTGQHIVVEDWEAGRYSPTPTIVEAAMALYAGHQVAEISRSDAGAINLSKTTDTISRVIATCENSGEPRKAICFVTGVPGAGKTLVGLNVATKYAEEKSLHSVFLSGNGPLVAILREALARDQVRRAAEAGSKLKKGTASGVVKAFIQNVHHFRDEYLIDGQRPPSDHVAVFDEAQRAWNLAQTASFMRRKKNHPNFDQSEPEFLISCLDRHKDWAAIVCLVGGGQEINTGEAGIGEWLRAVQKSFPHWHVYISPELHDEEYGADMILEQFQERKNLHLERDLHLAVSMRSFRAEHVSSLVKQVLDLETDRAREFLRGIGARYPIVLTRDLNRAKRWLKQQARGSERYGVLASSQAQRLKPHAIDVKSPMDPIHWFLDAKDDVRSSYYLEDVATEFHVQGLELDWSCVVWDGDFRYSAAGWQHHSFIGSRWQHILKDERRIYLKNAYRVLLTRARQGMVIVVPEGDENDQTRKPAYYDSTFNYLRSVGLRLLDSDAALEPRCAAEAVIS
jgi:schlafen family protein